MVAVLSDTLSDTLILSVQLVLEDTQEIEYKLIGRLDEAATKLAKIANRVRSQFYHGLLNFNVDTLIWSVQLRYSRIIEYKLIG